MVKCIFIFLFVTASVIVLVLGDFVWETTASKVEVQLEELKRDNGDETNDNTR